MPEVKYPLQLILPWPHSSLNPNRIVHFRARAKLKAAQKTDCYFIARAARVHHKLFPGNLHVSILFCPPDNRSRDLDNLLSSMKSGLDGIALAFGVNDKIFRPITVDFGEVIKGGSVKISFLQDEFGLTSNLG